MMRKFFGWLTLLLALAGNAAETQRIAVVDLGRVFQQYYKSRIAEESLQQQMEIFRAYLLKLESQIRGIEKEYRVAADAAGNIAISESERRKYEATARERAEELKTRRSEFEAYAADRQRQLAELEQRKRREILTEITAEVKRRATLDGYNLVLDSSDRAGNELPAVIWSSPAFDLTERVIQELNRGSRKPQTQEQNPQQKDPTDESK